ncbi:MAG: hypothetical protein M0R80_02980 [Proteobacteria bacterium]|jgi:hypothetical protein|nr:hypothetical protein [Pseudomonadota bacterium]
MGIPMGLGPIGLDTRVFKRKFRWTFKLKTECGDIDYHFVKTAARPNLDIEETEVNFLNAKTWIPGKGTWQPLEVTYYDCNSTEIGTLFRWLTATYDFTKPVELQQNSKLQKYKGVATLVLYDGCGNDMETWTLDAVWPKAIDFGDLAMDSNDICEVKLTLRYTNVKYESRCPVQQGSCGCLDCQE